ncbi:Imm70 family immunity protein [Rhizobium sp.]
MGLYLCIFDDEDELDGVQVGAYSDFGAFRSAVATHVEGGNVGSKCPTLMLHSDCDGEWSPQEADVLQQELAAITAKFTTLPPAPLGTGWQADVARHVGLDPANLYESFFDPDGEPLLQRLMDLAKCSTERNLPILFQ